MPRNLCLVQELSTVTIRIHGHICFLIGSPDITIEKAVSSAEESRTNSKCYLIIYQALRILCTNYLAHFETKRQSRLSLHVHM